NPVCLRAAAHPAEARRPVLSSAQSRARAAPRLMRPPRVGSAVLPHRFLSMDPPVVPSLRVPGFVPAPPVGEVGGVLRFEVVVVSAGPGRPPVGRCVEVRPPPRRALPVSPPLLRRPPLPARGGV